MKQHLRHTLTFDYNFHVQPVVDSRTMTVRSVELLLRGLGTSAPTALVGLGRKCPALARRLDGELLEKAARDALFDLLQCVGTVSFNCSARFIESGAAAVVVAAQTRRLPQLVDGLMLEIAADSLPDDTQQLVVEIRRLQQWGLKVALDDFNLGLLTDRGVPALPVNQVNFDARTCRALTNASTDPGAFNRLRDAVCGLSSKGIEVVLKQVENNEQLRGARSFGCGLLQGHAIGRPVAWHQFVKQRHLALTRRAGSPWPDQPPPSSTPELSCSIP